MEMCTKASRIIVVDNWYAWACSYGSREGYFPTSARPIWPDVGKYPSRLPYAAVLRADGRETSDLIADRK